ncbi:LytR/AlgR family response regulator transcription factor [Larkinella punicea]|uniref:DNA-binding response regulator n=1 Tax=Larkinella punicea TaxID=2315727 RepID=A0A368JFU3_9BACT|nr:LytTR family DNA-binding domain-containing protein [Larkinella punicea]RCR66527.1 DNA-binding response regulator [Larkinella punicea]
MDILIVEDEPLAVQKLVKLLNLADVPSRVVGITDGIESTVAWLKAHPRPDLILMDIELSDGQSFEIFNLVSIDCPVVFTTSYDEFAVKSFQVNRFDYLLKPIKKDELEQVLKRYKQPESATVRSADIGELVDDLRKQTRQPEFRSQFLAKYQQQLVSVDATEVRFFYTREGTTYLFGRNNNRYVVDYTLDTLEKVLEPHHFFRINEQFIVERRAVSQIHSYLNGQLTVDLDSGGIAQDIIVSRDRIRAFREWIGR